MLGRLHDRPCAPARRDGPEVAVDGDVAHSGFPWNYKDPHFRQDEPDDHGIGRSRGGWTTKAHALVDGRGLPSVIVVTPGQAGDYPALPKLLAELRILRVGAGRPRTTPDLLRGDKAYSSRAIRATLRARGITAVIPEPRDQIGHRNKRGAVVLRLDQVSAGYGDTTVLRDVDLAVPAGSTVALLGPNGAGKTTLLRLASGLIAPQRGRLLVDGVDRTGASSDQLAALGICHIPEGRGVFNSLSVRDNLRTFARGGDLEAAIEQVVGAFPRLGERINQIAGTMSGGEQQMLALSRTYVQHPKIVLLDEVSMGLAPKLVDEIFQFLQLLAAQGAGLLLVEQYVTKALAMADYVALLTFGSVSFVGEPQDVDGDELLRQYLGAAL